MLFEFIYKHMLCLYSEKKGKEKMKMNEICLLFDGVTISSIGKVRVLDGNDNGMILVSALPPGLLSEPSDGGHGGLLLAI